MVTLKLGVAPTRFVRLAGWVVMDGAVAVPPEMVKKTLVVTEGFPGLVQVTVI